jgi:hypothetical protein
VILTADTSVIVPSLLRWHEQLLFQAFPGQPLLLSSEGYRAVIRRLADTNLGGGRMYDAIVGAAAAEAAARLLTADRRAVATYVLIGVDFLLLE